MRLTFNKHYFALAVLIFLIEVGIALFVHDRFVRPYLGDVLVVILIYCFLQSFVKVGVSIAALMVLCFAFAVEYLQYLNIVEKLGLEESRLARTVIGTSFEWTDLLAYIIGIAMVLMAETMTKKRAADA